MKQWIHSHLADWILYRYGTDDPEGLKAYDTLETYIEKHPEVLAEGSLYSWPEILRMAQGEYVSPF